MVLALHEVLDRHLAATDPQVLSGHGRLGNEVRWVHSSEIFEIGPLLSGGELLLTTGLGLAGTDAGTRRHYIRELATRDVAGVAVELGRTFDEVPDEMIREASSVQLPLIALHTVVPFIDLCRAANTDIVSREVGVLRRRGELDAALHALMAAGAGAPAIVKAIAAAIGCPLVVLGKNNALMAAEGVDDDHSAWQVVDAQSASVPVQSRGQVIATLVAGPSSLDTDTMMSLLGLGAGPLGVALSMSRELGGLRHRAAATLMSDLLDRRVDRRPDLMMRSRAAGFDPAGAVCIVPVAISAPAPRMASQLTATVTKKLAVQSLHADVHATSYALFAMTDQSRDQITQVCAAFAGIVGETTVVVGNAARVDARDLSDALLTARRALAIASGSRRAMARHTDAVSSVRALAAELAVETLDAAVRDDLVTSVGPLVEWDRTHGSELTHTLEVHLRHGCSATRSAVALHLGRQSLYQRLERIRELLGFDFAAPETYPSVLLALCAHRSAVRSVSAQAD